MVTNRSYPSKVIPGEDLVPVILSDNLLPQGPCRALFIGTAGNLNITTLAGNDRDNIPVQAGLFPIQCIKVRPGASETAASNIWAVQFDQRIFDPDFYNFYVDFPSVTDLVSGNPLTTVLSATRYGYAGGEFGEDVPVIESGKLLTNGAYTQLIKKSEDISNSVWVKSGSPSISDTDGFTATIASDNVYQVISTTEGVLYTFNFIASVSSGGQTDNYLFRTSSSASGNDQAITALSEVPTIYSVTVLGRVGDGNVLFGFRDNNGANWAKVTITDFQVTESPYRLPYVPNDTTGTISVPLNYSDADEGIKAIGIAANFPQLLDALDGVADGVELFDGDFNVTIGPDLVESPAGVFTSGSATPDNNRLILDGFSVQDPAITTNDLIEATLTCLVGGTLSYYDVSIPAYVSLGTISPGEVTFRSTVYNDDSLPLRFETIGLSLSNFSVKQISPAQGRITISWTPRFDAADVTGVVHILTANDDATSFLFYNGATQEIHAYDGTNTAVVACTPVKDTEYQIILDVGDNSGQKMRLMVDSTVGTAVTNAGSFPVTADVLSIAWEEEVPQEIGEIIIEKEPTW